MQGKVIAVAYTLCTYWKFPLGGIRKQEKMHQCSFSIRGGQKHRILKIFDDSHNSFFWPEYFIDFYVKNGSHVRLRHPFCDWITTQRQYTAVERCVHLRNNIPCIITLGQCTADYFSTYLKLSLGLGIISKVCHFENYTQII